jgi:hypothetical protein
MQKVVPFLSIFVLFFCLRLVSSAYETTEVKNGGTVEGVVEFAGVSVPKDETLTVTSDIEFCGKNLPAEKYVIDMERRIKNVVVFIEEIKAGKSIPPDAVTVTNRNCVFAPHIAVGFKGNKFVMRNDDPVLHTFDVHVSLSGRELYHLSFHEKSSSVTKTLTKSGLLEISCYIHPWQHSYVYIFDHPYATVTNEKGEFVIKDVPPGVYTVEAWHEALGKLRLENVKILSGETSRIKLEYNWNIHLE